MTNFIQRCRRYQPRPHSSAQKKDNKYPRNLPSSLQTRRYTKKHKQLVFSEEQLCRKFSIKGCSVVLERLSPEWAWKPAKSPRVVEERGNLRDSFKAPSPIVEEELCVVQGRGHLIDSFKVPDLSFLDSSPHVIVESQETVPLWEIQMRLESEDKDFY